MISSFSPTFSPVRLNLNRPGEALHDAIEAIDLDPGYSKGYYRKGQVRGLHKTNPVCMHVFSIYDVYVCLVPTCWLFAFFLFHSLFVDLDLQVFMQVYMYCYWCVRGMYECKSMIGHTW